MTVIFARRLGFCSGVKRALKIARKAAKKGPKPVYSLGSLIHNERVIKELTKKNIKIIKNPEKAKSGTLIIRAHGVPPLSEKIKKNFFLVDATCPLVKKSQLLASSLSEKGYQVVIIGKKNHPETLGIKGYAKNKAFVVENKKQAKKIPSFKKIGVIPQTTQDYESCNKILKILEKKSSRTDFFNNVCPEVKARQKELKKIMKKADKILVIGSRKSSNTKKLVEICKENSKPVWRINSLEELKKKKIKRKHLNLGVVSGTSSPDREIERIKKYLLKSQIF
jgi:(E)-4-hydroxy-3-methyl-but-2-enyl pyrophosphate reductase